MADEKPDWEKVIDMEANMILEDEEIFYISTDLSADPPVAVAKVVQYSELENLTPDSGFEIGRTT